MRMKMYHTDLKIAFELFGRGEFTRTRFINKFVDGKVIPTRHGRAVLTDSDASEILGTLLRRKLVLYTDKSNNLYMRKMRISAKAIFEMHAVFEDFIEPTDEDYSEYALLNLTEN